jgi:tetratricopeptide (TPR) repeat protein
MQVADQMLRSGDNSQAARIFQRILELDPENTVTQTKLADLYMKLGKKAEARNIYFTAAEALYARGSYDAAGQALTRVLALDPENAKALMLRGMIAADGGDSASAAKYLGQVPDLDTHPEGLHALLHAKLQTGNAEGAEEPAAKLLTAHKDLSGLRTLAEWYLANNQIAKALKLYDRYEDRFLATDRAAFQALLQPLLDRIKDNPDAVATMQRVMQRASDTTHDAELLELQANACAQKGDLHQARDLYLKLSELEPDNAMHSQSYRQMLTRLGEDSATRDLSREEASQAFMVEELDEATAVHQSYDPPTEQAIEAALTDAELYVSYNVPAKAIPPLEAVLPKAPRDVSVNQRLAVLYTRSERYADAARVCQVLSDVYHELGHEKDAARYQEAARKYSLRAPSGSVLPAPPAIRAAVPHLAAPPPAPMPAMREAPINAQQTAEAEASSVQEFTFDVPDHLLTVEEPLKPAPEATLSPVEEIRGTVPQSTFESEEYPETHAETAEETDLSGEWESLLSVEEGDAPAAPNLAEMPVAPPAKLPPVVQAAKTSDPAAEKIDEIRFYISQQMWDSAKKAILDLTEIAPDAAEITELISAVSAGQSQAASQAPKAAPAPVFGLGETPSREKEELASEAEGSLSPANEPISEFRVDSTPPAPQAYLSRTQEKSPAKPAQAPPEVTVSAPPAHVAKPKEKSPSETISVTSPPVPPPARVSKPEKPLVEARAAAPEVASASEPAARKQKPELPARSSLEDVFAEPLRPPSPKAPPLQSPPSRPALTREPAGEPALDDILDLGTAPKPPKPAKSPAPASSKEKSTEDIISDFVLDMEKTDLADFVPRAKPEPIPPAPVIPPVPAHKASKNGDMQDAESASVLSHILADLQEETESVAASEDDSETHYNLGIAFKEMGLLDEAIGELQKVCHAMDRGSDFSQPIQAYTWLAQCLVDKGAPEAAVRWYQKALHLPRLDDGSRCAIYYDLAQAYEASGDKKSALANFMEVYGSNIDFRDVANRIKALKS